MIHYYYSDADNSTHKVPEAKDGSWIFAYDLDADDLRDLIAHGFDEVLLEDATDYFEVPRFEYENGVYYFFTRYTVDTKDGELSTAPLLLALSDSTLLTVSHRKPEFLDDYAHNRKQLVTTDSIDSFLTIIETMVNQYHRSLMNIRRIMLRYFGNVGNISDQDMKRFVGLESTVADYMSALLPTDSAVAALLSRHAKLNLNEEQIDSAEDIHQDIIQLIDSAKSVSKTIQNIRSAHSSILAHKLNTTMKTLTIVTIVLTIPTIVTSLFGMNTWLPTGSGPFGFAAIMVFIIGLSFIVAWWFKKNNWI